MTTPSKTASAIRAILKDYNVWPSSVLEPKISSTAVFDQAKILSIDKSLRKKYLEINPAYVMPSYAPEALGVTIRKHDSLSFTFNGAISSTVKEVNTYYNLLATEPGILPQFELAVERLEYYTQLYSAFIALQNPEMHTVHGGSGGIVSLIVSGGFGDPTITDGFRVIYFSTLLESL
ncbi:MAG: hypothetical protein ACRC2J_18320 [Microcoleaceae cyanobacterium]